MKTNFIVFLQSESDNGKVQKMRSDSSNTGSVSEANCSGKILTAHLSK